MLRHALAVPDPSKFLPGPSAAVDWRSAPVVAKAATPSPSEEEEEKP